MGLVQEAQVVGLQLALALAEGFQQVMKHLVAASKGMTLEYIRMHGFARD